MTTLTIRLGDCTTTVDALPVGVPGLMAHAAAGASSGWVLTHVRSGYAVAFFPAGTDPEVLLACARELAPLADWTASTRDLVMGLTLPQVRRITDRWGSVSTGLRGTDLNDLPGVAP